MKTITCTRVSTWALAIATCAMSFGAASAQEAGAGSQAEDAAASADEDEDGTIVVTGSRIRSEFDRPTPVSILGAERLEERGATNLGEALNELPVFRATQPF